MMPPVDSRLARARSARLVAAAMSAIAVVALVIAIPVNERAVRIEGGGVTDGAFLPLAIAALVAAVAGGISLRAAVAVERSGITLPAVLAVLAILPALYGALIVLVEPVFINVLAQTCNEAATSATPGPCGYQIPESDYSIFYPAAAIAAGAALLSLAAAVFLIRGRASQIAELT
jgi:hypothetical protein